MAVWVMPVVVMRLAVGGVVSAVSMVMGMPVIGAPLRSEWPLYRFHR